MMKAVKTAVVKLLFCANILIIVGLVVSGYSGIINPVSHPYLCLAGYAFPVFMYANAAFVVVWLLSRIRYVIVPLAGFLAAYSPMNIYCPMNFSANDYEDDMADNLDARKDSILKVLSYNILAFNTTEAPEGQPNPILEYIADSYADIICVQEYSYISGQDSLISILEDRYHYTDTIHSDGVNRGCDIIGIYSRFPIISKAHIPIHTKGNTLGVFLLNINGDTVHVINAHLETVGMSVEQKEQFEQLVHGNRERDAMKSDSKMIVSKLAASTAMRAPQADAINDYIRRHHGERIIFCGDINDHPLSYVRNTIAERLTDCFEVSGMGMGHTMHYNSMYVRIDNIMCSEHYEPLTCKVDKSVNLSDHFPIYCLLRAKNSGE